MTLKINGKFFLPPPPEGLDFKEVFRRMTLAGVGRPVDRDGVPIGPWTPELLTAAIAEISAGSSSVDLRTVQRWFSDSDQGIKTDNIRWLAKIFGCGDADATRRWQVELLNAQSRLAAKRRASRSAPAADAGQDGSQSKRTDTGDKPRRHGLAHNLPRLVENLFTHHNPFILPVILWTGFTTLAFLSYIFGVETITYSPNDGRGELEKQVGFLWAPSWTILPVIILPSFVAILWRLLTHWKIEAKNLLRSRHDQQDQQELTETTLLSNFTGLIWTVFFVSFVIVFALQWGGIHLRALLSGSSSGYMIDWNNVALVRPDVISINSAVFLSFFAYLYFGFVMWVLFAGLILLLALATDFQAVGSGRGAGFGVSTIKRRVANGIFRCTVLALLFVICIKLQSTYLIAGSESMSNWLWTDAITLLRREEYGQFFLHQRSIPQLTTIIILAVILLVFSTAYMRVSVVGEALTSDEAAARPNLHLWLAFVTIALLSANVFLIGAAHGFSLFLGCSFLMAIYSLCRPPFDE